MSSNSLCISRRSVLGGLMALGVGSAFVGCQPPAPGSGPIQVPVTTSFIPGATLAIFRAPAKHTVLDVAWSPNSRLLAYCTDGDTPDLRVCDVAAQKTLLLYQDDTVDYISGLNWLVSRTSQLSFLGLRYWVQTLDPTSGNTLASYNAPGMGAQATLYTFAWSRDGSRLALAGASGISILAGSNGNVLVSHPPMSEQPGYYPSYIVAWSPDGKTIASAGSSQAVQFWEASSGRDLSSFPERGEAIAAAWSPDGHFLAYMVGTNLVENAGELQPVQMLVREVQSGKMALSITGRFLVGATQGGPLAGPVIYAHSLAWSPDSRYLVTVGQGAEVQVWEVARQRLALSYHGHRATVRAVAWSPDGRFIASGGKDGTVQVWGAPLR
jgi:WD40 repeat protein